MSDTEKTSEQIVADANAEEREAAALIESLEDRVRNGDDAVKPDELEKARGLWGFAKLRKEAAAKKAAAVKVAEDNAEMRAKIAALMPDVLTGEMLHGPKSPGGHIAAAIKDIEKAIELCERNNAAVNPMSWVANMYHRKFPDEISFYGGSHDPNMPVGMPTVTFDEVVYHSYDVEYLKSALASLKS